MYRSVPSEPNKPTRERANELSDIIWSRGEDERELEVWRGECFDATTKQFKDDK